MSKQRLLAERRTIADAVMYAIRLPPVPRVLELCTLAGTFPDEVPSLIAAFIAGSPEQWSVMPGVGRELIAEQYSPESLTLHLKHNRLFVDAVTESFTRGEFTRAFPFQDSLHQAVAAFPLLVSHWLVLFANAREDMTVGQLLRGGSLGLLSTHVKSSALAGILPCSPEYGVFLASLLAQSGYVLPTILGDVLTDLYDTQGVGEFPLSTLLLHEPHYDVSEMPIPLGGETHHTPIDMLAQLSARHPAMKIARAVNLIEDVQHLSQPETVWSVMMSLPLDTIPEDAVDALR